MTVVPSAGPIDPVERVALRCKFSAEDRDVPAREVLFPAGECRSAVRAILDERDKIEELDVWGLDSASGANYERRLPRVRHDHLPIFNRLDITRCGCVRLANVGLATAMLRRGRYVGPVFVTELHLSDCHDGVDYFTVFEEKILLALQTLLIEDNFRLHKLLVKNIHACLAQFTCLTSLSLHIHLPQEYLTRHANIWVLLEPHGKRLKRLILCNGLFPVKPRIILLILDICPYLTHLGVMTPAAPNACPMNTKHRKKPWY